MKDCIKFWLEEYQKHYYVWFLVVNNCCHYLYFIKSTKIFTLVLQDQMQFQRGFCFVIAFPISGGHFLLQENFVNLWCTKDASNSKQVRGVKRVTAIPPSTCQEQRLILK